MLRGQLDRLLRRRAPASLPDEGRLCRIGRVAAVLETPQTRRHRGDGCLSNLQQGQNGYLLAVADAREHDQEEPELNPAENSRDGKLPSSSPCASQFHAPRYRLLLVSTRCMALEVRRIPATCTTLLTSSVFLSLAPKAVVLQQFRCVHVCCSCLIRAWSGQPSTSVGRKAEGHHFCVSLTRILGKFPE